MILAKRYPEAEVMDDPALSSERHLEALRGLERINGWSRSLRILWEPIRDLALEGKGRALRILDIATGGADLAIGLWKKAKENGLAIEVDGSDKSPVAIEWARKRARKKKAPLQFFQLDALTEKIPSGYDVLVTSLFLHHLNEEQAVLLLARMAEAARRMIMVNDLVRSGRGWALAYAGSRLLTRSKVVHRDALLSVRAAFTMEEVRRLAQRAGLDGCLLERKWPLRFRLVWRKA